MSVHFGKNGLKNVKEIYIGVGGVPKKVKEGYIGINGKPKLFYSAITSSWIEIKMPSSNAWNDIAFGDGKFVAVGSGKVGYTTNGTDWTIVSVSNSYYKVAYGNNKFVAITSGGKVGYSTDGIVWTETGTLPITSGYWNNIAFGNGKFIASRVSDGNIAYSEDGITWGTANLPSSFMGTNVAFGNGKFVAVGWDNFVAYSTNGVNWYSASIPMITAAWCDVTFGNGKFVTVSSTGQTAYSTDGTAWTISNTIFGFRAFSVIFGNGKFVAVGEGEKDYFSKDGITWESEYMPFSASWQAIAYGGGRFIAVSSNKANTAYKLADVSELVTITISVDPDGGGTASGGGVYDKGDSVTVTAEIASGYVFSEWRENGVSVSKSKTYTFTAENDRNLVAVFALKPSRLPAGYTEVEWISNGENGNSNYRPFFKMPGTNTAVRMEIKFEFGKKLYSSSYLGIFGQASSATNGYVLGTQGTRLLYLVATTPYDFLSNYETDTQYTVALDYQNSRCEINGSIISRNPGVNWRTNANYFFGPITNIYSISSNVKVYYLQMFDTNGNLVLDFVPCINLSGIAGMYDTIGKKFYKKENTSAAAYDFIAGPTV